MEKSDKGTNWESDHQSTSYILYSQKIASFQILNLLSLVSLTMVKTKKPHNWNFCWTTAFFVDESELFRDRTWYKKLRVSVPWSALTFIYRNPDFQRGSDANLCIFRIRNTPYCTQKESLYFIFFTILWFCSESWYSGFQPRFFFQVFFASAVIFAFVGFT